MEFNFGCYPFPPLTSTSSLDGRKDVEINEGMEEWIEGMLNVERNKGMER